MRTWVALGSSFVAVLALSLWAATQIDRRAGPPIVIEPVGADATIVVAVAGAVASPGVVGLAPGARLGDALAAAGGAAPDADLAALNPALRLRDGERVVVPRRPATPAPGGAAASGAPAAGGPLDLNTASAQELDGLPGIGPVLAQRIVDHRAAEGPFGSVDDLIAVSGISGRMVDDLRALVTVGS